VANADGGCLGNHGRPKFSVTTGYFYSIDNPYTQYEQAQPPPAGSAYYTPRNEITVGVSSKWGQYRFSGFARRDIQLGQMVAAGADAAYEDECFILALRLYRRYTSFNGDHGATVGLVQLTFKTVGQFGFRAL
jgi:LPS-assembly protein